jgi:hypothetical protein
MAPSKGHGPERNHTNTMKTCIFCLIREIIFCKYNHKSQNCCGGDKCLEKRRKGYQATVKKEKYHKDVKVRERANRQRRARRRATACPLMPRILKKCIDETKRVIEPAIECADKSTQVLVKQIFAAMEKALEVAL